LREEDKVRRVLGKKTARIIKKEKENKTTRQENLEESRRIRESNLQGRPRLQTEEIGEGNSGFDSK
jgi:hypothetical protein